MNLFPEWQGVRSRVNHDWLKNSFINHLKSLANLPEDRHTRKVVAGNMDEWLPHIEELQRLIDTIEYDMSPARLFEQAPLSGISEQQKAWICPLLHESWRKKNDIPGIKKKMEKGSKEIERAFSVFKPKFENGDFTSNDVIKFVNVCQKFSEYLSTLRELSIFP